ncbi:clathrin, light polypeptide (Lca), isoform CRA_a [Mus musculus]|nr:clathrin, light polypeptide (Lca), isoform CRA_a [Mus musculus]
MNGEYYQESNGPTDSYAAISEVDRLQSEPESIRKWREEQTERLEALDANSRKQEAEWKEKAIKELEEWYARQDEQLQKTKANNSHPQALSGSGWPACVTLTPSPANRPKMSLACAQSSSP